jgi:hypothetical protein
MSLLIETVLVAKPFFLPLLLPQQLYDIYRNPPHHTPQTSQNTRNKQIIMIKTNQTNERTKQQNTKNQLYVTHFAEEIRIISEAIFCLVPNIYSSLEQVNIYLKTGII